MVVDLQRDGVIVVSPESKPINGNVSLWVLFVTFLKIGSTAFGGYMALISVVESYVVNRKKYISSSEMLDGVTLATILPGPMAVNVVAYVGYKVRGVFGALCCVLAVMLPSFVLVLLLSYMYFTWGNVPSVNKVFTGFIPAVAAIIMTACYNMGKKVIAGPYEVLIFVMSFLALVIIGGFYCSLAIMLASAIAGLYMNSSSGEGSLYNKDESHSVIFDGKAFPYIISALTLLFISIKYSEVIQVKLFTVFTSLSVLLFGGGFVFIPMIQETVVESYGWLTHQEFIDGIALGQITPGPILISATFIGYKVAGVSGAVVATLSIFLPPAIIMVLCSHYLQIIKSSSVVEVLLKGMRCGVIGMIAASSYAVIKTAQPDYISLLIFASSLVALVRYKVEVAWIIPLAGVVGYLMY